GELEHRRVKRFYAQTNKIKFVRGIAKQQRRERLLYKLRQKAAQQANEHLDTRDTDSRPTVNFSEREALPQCSPESQYQISNSRHLHWDLTAWLHKNREDLADFLLRLKDHILTRLLGHDDDSEQAFTPAQRNSLIIVNNKIYRHKVLRVNYTTYDL
ncbi:hypothetical protein F4604DRAFT_1518137, partial [Suillus subluteus]